LKLASRASLDEIFSWKSPSAKPYVAQRGRLTDDQLIELMLHEPRLIRRPIAVRGARIVVGLNEQALGKLLSSSG
jgi:arsenate reductase-like glutaredoxin family protein